MAAEMHFDRVIRTATSERFMLRRDKTLIAALELHYLPSGKVDGTLIVLEESGFAQDKVGDLLAEIDRRLLPEVSVSEGNLFFTVVVGRILGSFEPDK
jgi:hypothetical protein